MRKKGKKPYYIGEFVLSEFVVSGDPLYIVLRLLASIAASLAAATSRIKGERCWW